MTSFYHLNDNEKRTVLKYAKEFYQNHTDYCRRTIQNAQSEGYPPSGSDCFHPELWKGSHWKWFTRDGISNLNDLGD